MSGFFGPIEHVESVAAVGKRGMTLSLCSAVHIGINSRYPERDPGLVADAVSG